MIPVNIVVSVSLLCLFYTICTCELSPLVHIDQGKLRGVLKTDWKGGDFYSFLSIPYARKPIGNLRFMLQTKNLKPVMVYIHGGGFVEGHGRNDLFGAEFLMPEGVVLVTINYRLGLFGFLNFENSEIGVFGNMGMKDQAMALRWVKKNIEKFGGDPNSVTIFGESAGGCSVHLHSLSPMSQG
ncbi:carboxylesterase [Holotrichia oblita]|uniref:Carboxylesterase n=1 Tax=Holotrichia oblita TaxID=644536 RepID=A0ACB9TQ96_HOLOL|nr:carboxylesterase [Holotrichia oblita]